MANTTTTMMTIQSQVGIWLPFAEGVPDSTTGRPDFTTDRCQVKLAARGRRGRSRLDELEVVADPYHRPAVAAGRVGSAVDRLDGRAVAGGAKRRELRHVPWLNQPGSFTKTPYAE
jgi:hypothetical protein